MRLALTAAILALFLAAPLRAQPAEVNRTLHTFDFEERRQGNHEDLPMRWQKVEGPGLPHYVHGRLTTDHARSGQYSFRFDLDGGSILYRYPAGLLPVRPGAHYRIEGYVQTTALPNARARITAYFTDVDGHALPATARSTAPYASGANAGDWHKLCLDLSAEPPADPGKPAPAFLVVELGLLQPGLYSASTLGEHALYPQDIYGTAWFDDVSVAQVPKISLSSTHPDNIFHRGEPLRLQVEINDRFTDDLEAQLVIRDAKGRDVYQRSGALDMAAADSPGPTTKRLPLDLPDLRPGWYSASLVMSSQGQFVGEQHLDLVYLPDDVTPPGRPDPRFGVVATRLPFDAWQDLPDLLPALGAARVKLALWNADADAQLSSPGTLDTLLERLAERGITPTACLTALPPPIAAKLHGSSLAKLLTADPNDWQPQLAYLVSRHANHLDRWQLGEDGTNAFVAEKDMRTVYNRVYNQFATLMQSPDLAMPWPALYEIDGAFPASVALTVPSTVLPSQIPLYLQDLKGPHTPSTQPSAPTQPLDTSSAPSPHNPSLTLEFLNAQTYGPDLQLRDYVQRFVYALTAGATRIDVPLPLATRKDGDALLREPQEMFLVTRTLLTTLAHTTYEGKVPIADGVEAFLFDRQGQGILCLWDRGTERRVKPLALTLGQHPTRVDLWGNAAPLIQLDPNNTGKVQLTVGPTPMFIVDIDGQLARLRASVGLDQPLLESSYEAHTRRLHFTNPYKETVGGTVKLHAPPGWTLTPASFTFTLNPGETFDRALSVEFPYNAPAGTKSIDADFNIQADRNAAITVPIALTLGLSDVGMQTLALRDGRDVMVQQMITNYSEKPIDYTAFATYPGQSRQEHLITALAPGRTVMKRYRFPGAAAVTEPTRVRVGLREQIGTRVLNDEVPVQ